MGTGRGRRTPPRKSIRLAGIQISTVVGTEYWTLTPDPQTMRSESLYGWRCRITFIKDVELQNQLALMLLWGRIEHPLLGCLETGQVKPHRKALSHQSSRRNLARRFDVNFHHDFTYESSPASQLGILWRMSVLYRLPHGEVISCSEASLMTDQASRKQEHQFHAHPITSVPPVRNSCNSRNKVQLETPLRSRVRSRLSSLLFEQLSLATTVTM